MDKLQLWLRIGDGDGYEEFGDDFDALVEMLAEAGVSEPLVRHGKYGVSSAGFEGQNYISLYWGDRSANGERQLSGSELARVNRLLEQEQGKRHDLEIDQLYKNPCQDEGEK